MYTRYRLDAGRKAARWEVVGSISNRALRRICDKVIYDFEKRPGLRVLMDLRGQENIVSPDMVWETKHRFEGSGVTSGLWALVVSNLAALGMGNMLAMLLENTGVVVRVFEDPRAACEWLCRTEREAPAGA